MIKHLVRKTGNNKHVIIGRLISGQFEPKLDHLACFLPGTLLLGYQNGLPETHLKLAIDLLESCYVSYTRNPTHLAGESTRFSMTDDTISVDTGDSYNLLRPEFVESLYYFWAFTGNATYQDWGWNIFMAVEKYAKCEDGGYTSLRLVDRTKIKPMDHMETFFLAETLKYFYLLFSDNRNEIHLNKFVFNTEQHPLSVLQ